MTKAITKISVRAYADSLNISDKTVRNAIADGKIKKGVSYSLQSRKGVDVHVPEIVKEIADEEWGFIYQTDKTKPGQKKVERSAEKPQAKSAKSSAEQGAELSADLEDDEELAGETEPELISTLRITKNMTFREASRRREVIAAALDKMKLQELEGSLVRKSDVEKNLFAFGDQMKKELLNIPARCIDDIMAAKNKVEGMNFLTIEIEQVLNKLVSGNIL